MKIQITEQVNKYEIKINGFIFTAHGKTEEEAQKVLKESLQEVIKQL